MSPKFLIFILLSIFLVSACSNESPTTPTKDPNTLLTIHLGENILQSVLGGIVFASDSEGNLLDLATYDGPTTIVLKSTDVHPDTISFTLVPNTASSLDFFTELGVPAGSVRTLAGVPPSEFTGKADLTFLNVPEFDTYRLSSNVGGISGTGSLDQRSISVYGDSTDCFVRVNPLDGGPIAGWFHDLKPGDSDTLDFDQEGDFVPMTGTTVQIPSGGDYLTCQVYGSVISGASEHLFTFDSQHVGEPVPDSIIIFAPVFDPSRLATRFDLSMPGSPRTIYFQESTGPIPAAFTKLEGELTVTSTSPDSLVFTTTADWDQSVVKFGPVGRIIDANWNLRGPASIQAFALPQIPQELLDHYPALGRDVFELRFVEIRQNPTGQMVRSLGKGFGSGGWDKAPRGTQAGSPGGTHPDNLFTNSDLIMSVFCISYTGLQ